MPKGQVPIGKYIHLKQEVEKVAYQNGFDAGVEKAYKEGFQAGQQTAVHANGQLIAVQNELAEVRKQLQTAHDDFWEIAKERDRFRKSFLHIQARFQLVEDIMDLDVPTYMEEVLNVTRSSSGYDSEPGIKNERSGD